MKESRLFQLLYYILDREKVTAAELAEKFEVSVRTIYRDIDWISGMGIPIYTTQGKGGGIEIDSNYTLDKSMLSTKEKEQIIIALDSLKNIKQFEGNDLLSKLSVLFDVKNTDWVEVDLTYWQHNESSQLIFEQIKRAIFNKKMLSLEYCSMNGELTKRTIKPIRLVFKGQDWYLYAFCDLRNDFRFFKLSRIRELILLSEIYEDDYSDLLIDKNIEFEQTIPIQLRFDKSIAYRIIDDNLYVSSEDDDYLYLELELPDNYQTYSYLLSFGADVEVVSPAKIRKKIKKIAEAMAKKYNI